MHFCKLISFLALFFEQMDKTFWYMKEFLYFCSEIQEKDL